MYLYIFLFFMIGIICSNLFELLGYRLPKGDDLFRKNSCDKCNHDLKFYESLPIISFLIQKGRCKYCHQRISIMYIVFEIVTGILFALTYFIFREDTLSHLKIILGILFIGSLLIVCFSDFKYMIISDEVLLIFSAAAILLKLFIQYSNEEIITLMDLGYSLIDIIIDVVLIYLVMFVIKKIGDFVFKKESLGKGDLKLMAYIAIILGFKLSIVTIFIASFIALPVAIISNLRKDKLMLPFGPFLAIGAIILFLLRIDFNSILELLH